MIPQAGTEVTLVQQAFKFSSCSLHKRQREGWSVATREVISKSLPEKEHFVHHEVPKKHASKLWIVSLGCVAY